MPGTNSMYGLIMKIASATGYLSRGDAATTARRETDLTYQNPPASTCLGHFQVKGQKHRYLPSHTPKKTCGQNTRKSQILSNAFYEEKRGRYPSCTLAPIIPLHSSRVLTPTLAIRGQRPGWFLKRSLEVTRWTQGSRACKEPPWPSCSECNGQAKMGVGGQQGTNTLRSSCHPFSCH